MDVKIDLNQLRDECRQLGERVKDLKKHDFFTSASPPTGIAERGEMQANIMLAYRHLEDARMRLGKVIQAYEGGVSVYDK